MKCKLQTSSIASLNSATRYIDPCSSSAIYSTETVGPCPTAGTFRKLFVKMLTDPDTGASAKGFIFTLRKNATDTLLTVTILSSTASFQGSEITQNITVVAGDLISISIVPTGSPTNSPRFTTSVEFESSTTNESILMGGIVGAALLPTTNANFVCIAGQKASTTTEANFYTVMPCAGTITQLYTQLNTAPGGATTRTLQLRVNNANQGTTITYTSAQTGVKSQSQSVTIAAGDLVCLESDVSGTPASSRFGVGIVFAPTTDGNFVIPCSAPSGNLSGAALRFASMATSGSTYSGTEANTQQLATTDYSYKGYTAWFNVSPSPGTYTVSLRENAGAAGTTFSSAIGTQGPNSVSGGPFTTGADFNLLDTSCNPSSATAASIVISWLGFITPASTFQSAWAQNSNILIGGW